MLQGLWDWMVDQEADPDQATGATTSQQTTGSEQVDGTPITALPASTIPTPTTWRTKWNALSSYFSSRPTEQKEASIPKNRPDGKVKPPVRAPLGPVSKPTPTPTATATATPTEAAPTQTPAPIVTNKQQERLAWWQKQYDLRPLGGGVVVDFRWGRG
ncbi:hypothetical protein FRC11_011051 [Ceratobasidium sp. 423]|nr:hypothetical protein FRC11_011051 [Ceratobasidium sp. 423]